MPGSFLPELVAAPVEVSASAETVAVPTLMVSDTWHRVSVVPGLEVHWHTTASTEVQALARKLVDEIWGRA